MTHIIHTDATHQIEHQANCRTHETLEPQQRLAQAHADATRSSDADSGESLARRASLAERDVIAPRRITADGSPHLMHKPVTSVGGSACHDQHRHTLRRHPRLRHDELAALVAAAARGDQRAWSLVVRHQSPMIRAIARRHRLGAPDQDDVVQRTWLTFFQHVEQLKDPTALTGWLATTARRECLRILARTQREVLVDEPPRVDDRDPTPIDEAVAQSERRVALHTALNSLPCHQRRLMRTLLAKPDASYDQLSVALGIPRGSIGPTRKRCIARLRRDPHLARVVAP